MEETEVACSHIHGVPPSYLQSASSSEDLVRTRMTQVFAIDIHGVFFIILIAGFLHISRIGDVFPQPPTAALQNEELTGHCSL